MERALITGCAGFIGSHLTETLLDRGWAVTGIDSFAPTYETAQRRHRVEAMTKSRHFRFTEGNLSEMELAPFIEEADVVYHLAARPGVRASWGDFGSAVDANIFALQRLLDALIQRPELRLIFVSSSSVYGQADEYPTPEDVQLRPISPYGVTKAAGEALVGAYASQFGINAAMLRYFTVYGPRQRSDMAFHRWIRAAMEGRSLLLYGDGTAIRDFTYVSDVVEATTAASSGPAGLHAYNIAGGSPATLLEVFDLISEILGVSLKIQRQSGERGDPHRTGGDTALIRDQLGWEPRVSLKEGLTAQVEWMKSTQDD